MYKIAAAANTIVNMVEKNFWMVSGSIRRFNIVGMLVEDNMVI